MCGGVDLVTKKQFFTVTNIKESFSNLIAYLYVIPVVSSLVGWKYINCHNALYFSAIKNWILMDYVAGSAKHF